MANTFASKEAQEQIDAILTYMDEHRTADAEAVMTLLNVKHSTACGYLRHIWQELRLIHPLEPDEVVWGKTIKRYEIGADQALPVHEFDIPKRPRSSAVQVGMWRDGLVAALFGAAGGVVA